MAIILNERDIAAEPFGRCARRQRLIGDSHVKGTSVLLDRMAIEAAGAVDLEVPPRSVAWFYVLDGEARMTQGPVSQRLAHEHAVFLAPGSEVRLESRAGAALLYVEVVAACRLDPELSVRPPSSRVIDWTREPVLDSKHDARKRIYMATPKLLGTRAIKAEMIMYPPSTSGSKHRHQGAEHFKYMLKGQGTSHADDHVHSLRRGDVVYHPAGEWHYSTTGDGESMEFIEFFVPGAFATEWANERICTWLPTGRDIRGEKPLREIPSHADAEAGTRDL
jgi:quercetin dioxygenase-like cupin family protein